MPNGDLIATGAGTLYHAPLATTEPADLVTAWAAGWTNLGYTREGHTQSYSLEFADIEVAETLDPIRRVTTKRDIRVAFALAEITLSNLKRVLNGGTVTAGGGGTYSTYEPPDVGSEVRGMLGWESESEDERVVWRKVLQVGNLEVSRRKGADYATFTAEFAVENPGGATKPFKHIAATARV